MEPNIDSEKWQGDSEYRYLKIDELLAYLDTFVDFEVRLKYYRKLCTQLGGNYPLYGALKYYKHEGSIKVDGRNLDEYNVEIPFKLFGIFPKTENDKRELNKFAFNERKEDLFHHTVIYPKVKPIVIPYNELVKRFHERLIKTPIKSEFIKGEYERINTLIDSFSGYEKTASELAYKDLMLIDTIDWGSYEFISISRLGVALACIWDLIEYQIFLKNIILHIDTFLKDSFKNVSQKISFKELYSNSFNIDNSLQCKLTNSQISFLFENLSSGGYIDSRVTNIEFAEVINGTDMLSVPILWMKSNRDLGYLFTTMYEREMIDNLQWKSIIEKRNAFVNKRGKVLTAQDLSQAICDYQQKGNPKEASNLEVILQAVKNHEH